MNIFTQHESVEKDSDLFASRVGNIEMQDSDIKVIARKGWNSGNSYHSKAPPRQIVNCKF